MNEEKSKLSDKEKTSSFLKATAQGAAGGMAFGPGGVIPGALVGALLHVLSEEGKEEREKQSGS